MRTLSVGGYNNSYLASSVISLYIWFQQKEIPRDIPSTVFPLNWFNCPRLSFCEKKKNNFGGHSFTHRIAFTEARKGKGNLNTRYLRLKRWLRKGDKYILKHLEMLVRVLNELILSVIYVQGMTQISKCIDEKFWLSDSLDLMTRFQSKEKIIHILEPLF